MSYDISNIDPANYSRNNPVDSDVFFKISGLSEDDLKDLSIVSVKETIFRNGEFSFNYSNSEYNILEDGITFLIEKNTAYKKGSSEIIKIFLPQKINYIYHISFISGKPYLYYSNISEGDLVKSPKKIRLEFGDHFETLDSSSLNISLNKNKIINNGSISSDFSNYVEIEDLEFLSITIDHPEFFRNDNYKLEYSISNSIGKTLFGKIEFSIKLSKVILPSLFPQATFEGFNLGLNKVTNQGDGSSAVIEWNEFLSRLTKSEVYSLIYINEKRLSIFDEEPSYIAPPGSTSVTVSGLSTGVATAVAVRGMEAFKGVFSTEGMTSNEGGGFIFPSKVQSSENFIDTSFELVVESTENYPNKGLLIVDGSEVVKYTSKSDTSFFIAQNEGRGLNGTSISSHPAGVFVKIFYQCQDKNTNIATVTASFHRNNGFDRESNLVGNVVTDFTEDDKRFYQGYDYCGYHQALPNRVLEGIDDCGSYLGGEFNKQRGFNIFDRAQSRNEVLLEQVGEPVILLKRKWSGTNCDCVDLRRQHPRDKTCGICFGTGFLGGFDQFSNQRREDRNILVRFKETKHDLELSMNKHLSTVMEPSCWTMPIPTIRDRDIIIRFGFSGEPEYIYEVLNVDRERFVYQHYGRQNLSLKRLDKTDIIYTYDYLRTL